MGMLLPISRPPRTTTLLRPPSRGIGLVEVLVGMLLLAGTLMGTLAMQARLQQAALHLRQQQDAMALAEQLAVLLRAQGQPLAQAAAPFHWQAADPFAPDSCSDAPCADPQQQLRHALSVWQQQATSLLPQLRLQLCPITAATPMPTDWACPASNAASVLLIQLGWQDTPSRGSMQAPELMLPVALPRNTP